MRTPLPTRVVLLLITAAAVSTATPAYARRYVVKSMADTTTTHGKLTLRQAIFAANSGQSFGRARPGGCFNTIDLRKLRGTISLSSPLPAVQSSLTIVGPGADKLTISGANQYRILSALDGDLTMSGVRLADGVAAGGKGADGSYSGAGGGGAGFGGAMLVATSATVHLTNVAMNNNIAIGGDGGNALTEAFLTAGGGGGGIGGDAKGIVGGSGEPLSGVPSTSIQSPDGAGGSGGPIAGSGEIYGGVGGLGGGGGGGFASISPFGTVDYLKGGNGGAGGYGGGGGAGGQAFSAFNAVQGAPGIGGHFAGDSGSAGGPGGGGAGLGGAVFVASGGTVVLDDCTFTSNSAIGGQPGTPTVNITEASPGTGHGGAIHLMEGAIVWLHAVHFSQNLAPDATQPGEATAQTTDTEDICGTAQPLLAAGSVAGVDVASITQVSRAEQCADTTTSKFSLRVVAVIANYGDVGAGPTKISVLDSPPTSDAVHTLTTASLRSIAPGAIVIQVLEAKLPAPLASSSIYIKTQTDNDTNESNNTAQLQLK